MTNLTTDEIAAKYATLAPSVDLINQIVSESAPYLDTLDELQRNLDHLTQMRAADFWTNEDFTATDAAILVGTERIASIAANGVERGPSVNDVNLERDRRLVLDFEFQGKMYQRDAKSIARISGAGALALGAMVGGAQAGNLNWHGRSTPFAWIASDDTLTTMDAQTCFAFGQAAAAVETEIVFAAKVLREMDPIPADYADDAYWS